jgi:hypothetical protein
MADNTASLVVALSAQLTKFEKDMKAAGVMADNAVSDIEDKFSKMNPQAGASFLGNLFSNLVTKGIETATKALTEFYDRFLTLEKESRILSLSMEDVWGFQEAAKAGGASVEEATKSLRNLEVLLAGMQRGDTNSLTKLLDANPEAMRGVNRETLTLQQTWQLVANLIADTRIGVEKIEVGRLAGMSEDMALSLDKAGGSFSAMQKAAAATAPPLSDMVEKAKEFDSWMKSAADWFKADFVRSMERFREIYLEFKGLFGGVAASSGQALITGAAGLKSEAERKAEGRLNTGPGTQLPAQEQAAARADAYERETRAIDKQIAVTQAQAATVGESAYAQEEYRVQLVLTEKAVETYGEVTSKVNDEIALQATRAAQAKQALAEHQFALQRLNSASQAVGSALSTAFADAIVEGKSLNDVMASLIKTLEKAAINSLVMSFFTPGAGQSTSLFGSLLPKFAGGTDSAPGGMAMVGEHGPELVNLPRGSQVIPNDVLRSGSSGGSIVYSPAIDARGASVEAVARLAQIMEQDRASFASRTVQTIQQARRGRVPGL